VRVKDATAAGAIGDLAKPLKRFRLLADRLNTLLKQGVNGAPKRAIGKISDYSDRFRGLGSKPMTLDFSAAHLTSEI
jgi:hypothetical protein